MLDLERRRARDTSLPDWCEIQDNDRFVTLETFGSKFPGGLLPADLRAAVAACSHSGGGGGRYSPAGFCCCCFGSPPPFPSLTSSRVRLLGASFSFFSCRANAGASFSFSFLGAYPSEVIRAQYAHDGFSFLHRVFNDPSYLEDLSGITELNKAAEDMDMDDFAMSSDDEEGLM